MNMDEIRENATRIRNQIGEIESVINELQNTNIVNYSNLIENHSELFEELDFSNAPNRGEIEEFLHNKYNNLSNELVELERNIDIYREQQNKINRLREIESEINELQNSDIVNFNRNEREAALHEEYNRIEAELNELNNRLNNNSNPQEEENPVIEEEPVEKNEEPVNQNVSTPVGNWNTFEDERYINRRINKIENRMREIEAEYASDPSLGSVEEDNEYKSLKAALEDLKIRKEKIENRLREIEAEYISDPSLGDIDEDNEYNELREMLDEIDRSKGKEKPIKPDDKIPPKKDDDYKVYETPTYNHIHNENKEPKKPDPVEPDPKYKTYETPTYTHKHEVISSRKSKMNKWKKRIIIGACIVGAAVLAYHFAIPLVMTANSTLWHAAVGLPRIQGVLHGINTILGQGILGASYTAGTGAWTLAGGSVLNAAAASSSVLGAVAKLGVVGVASKYVVKGIKNLSNKLDNLNGKEVSEVEVKEGEGKKPTKFTDKIKEKLRRGMGKDRELEEDVENIDVAEKVDIEEKEAEKIIDNTKDKAIEGVDKDAKKENVIDEVEENNISKDEVIPLSNDYIDAIEEAKARALEEKSKESEEEEIEEKAAEYPKMSEEEQKEFINKYGKNVFKLYNYVDAIQKVDKSLDDNEKIEWLKGLCALESDEFNNIRSICQVSSLNEEEQKNFVGLLNGKINEIENKLNEEQENSKGFGR